MKTDIIQQTKGFAESHALKFTDHGAGHVQIEGHGVLVNYYPLSKRQTAHVKGGETIYHCTPWDAVKLCLGSAKKGLRPDKKPSKNGPDFDMTPVSTNPAGIKHFYTGNIPPWEIQGEFIMAASDLLRIEAMEMKFTADAMDFV